MPHDCNGVLVEEGAKVLLTGTVTNVSENADYCNCTVSIDQKAGDVSASLALNAKSVQVLAPCA